MNYTYKIIQKVMALKPTYKIMDETGNEIYKVSGNFLGREKFEIDSMDSNVLATCSTDLNFLSVVSNLFSINFKGYNIEVNGNKELTMRRTKNIFSLKLHIESSLGEMQLNHVSGFEFELVLNGEVVCKMKKKRLKIGGDEYDVSFNNKEDALRYLMATISLDRIWFTAR